MCVNQDHIYGQKAECLACFSCEKSRKKLMLLDIQGSANHLYHPEIASIAIEMFQEGKVLFCVGNLYRQAIDTFIQLHKCNKYCKHLKLNELVTASEV